ncbi:Zinc finger SWIM-type [Arabidopsis suecica]|uniref:Zinc finger SWIM-type n=1 Tax=Arabidopsis suecica TaxID=45249 RepID=A0A8T1YPN6_ARASU|nr:Zinc finger SWIM-type [Arabidopsis suecica]
MNQVILVCGKWILEKNIWSFVIDNKRGCRVMEVNRETSYDQCIQMVFEDYGLQNRVCDVVLSYEISKMMSQSLPGDTPPVFISNSRQFHTFLGLLKSNTIRLCVEVKRKNSTHCNEIDNEGVTANKLQRKRERNENVMEEEEETDLSQELAAAVEVDEEDEEIRFDYCDDSDGTDSDDENFSLYGIPPEEKEKPNLPMKKRSLGTFIEEQKEEDHYATLEMSAVELAVGQCYETKEHLETRLKILTVVQKFDFFVYKSTPFILVVKCWVQGCTWKVRATPTNDYPKFHVRKYVSEHTCSVTDRSARARQATHDILGVLYKDFVGGVGPTVLPMHVAEAMNKRFQIKMEYWKAYRTLRHARELVRGSPESGYEQLPTYLYMIRRANPGTLTRLEVDATQRFKYLFLAFGASMLGFPYMRKVVVVDGTFLQGKYKGTLLTATAQDGNFQIFPIAFAVVDTENDESWEWFFKQLSCVIPDDDSLAIISDRHQSIGKAIKKVYPKSSRGICTYHMYKNILVRFKDRDAFGLVKKAANAFRLVDFQTTFDQIEALSPALHNYLERADVRLWTRVHFPGDRYNLLTSNIAESMNNVMSHARSFPIVQLLDEVRSMMTRWFSERRNDALKLTTALTRGVEKILQSRVEYAKLLTVQAIDAHQFQVTHGSSLHVVNLRDKKCTCRRFDLEKLPCAHAIAAGENRKVSRISMCHPYYHKNYLCNSYANAIMPRDFAIPVPDHVATKICLPPEARQQLGRPKKSRIKSALEIAMEKKKPRKLHTCGKCNQVGHNRKTCNS